MVLALDLLIPPLVLLIAGVVVLACLGLLAVLLGAGWLVLFLPMAELLLLASAIVLAFVRFGRAGLRVSDVGGLLSFVFGKVAIYWTGFAAARTWVRTDRN